MEVLRPLQQLALTAPLLLHIWFSNSPLKISASCRNSSGFLNIKIQDNNNNKNLWDYTAVLQTTNLIMLISETRILFLSIGERRSLSSLFSFHIDELLQLGNGQQPGSTWARSEWSSSSPAHQALSGRAPPPQLNYSLPSLSLETTLSDDLLITGNIVTM